MLWLMLFCDVLSAYYTLLKILISLSLRGITAVLV